MKKFACYVMTVSMLLGTAAVHADDPTGMYMLKPDPLGKVLTAADGRTVFRYMTKKPEQSNLTANSVCCLYPLYTPSGVRVIDFAPDDHKHHRGVFLAWHAMELGKRADFWGWGAWAPTENRVVTNRQVRLAETSQTEATVKVNNDWMLEGESVIDDEVIISVKEVDKAFVVDLVFTLTPQVDGKIDQTAFGGFCVKARKDGKARLLDSQGEVDRPKPHHLKPETNWPAAAWYDYEIALDEGKTVGVAVIDHPSNPPATWHNLTSISMLNPCIAAPGEVKLTKGEPLVLRYRVVAHDGPADIGSLSRLATEFRGK